MAGICPVNLDLKGECPVAGVSPVDLDLRDDPVGGDGRQRGVANVYGTPMDPSTVSGVDTKQSKRATIKVCRVSVYLHLNSH
jgi:hypothetical protein